jgi:hypothetical protein
MTSSGEDIADKHFQNTNVQGRLWSTYNPNAATGWLKTNLSPLVLALQGIYGLF